MTISDTISATSHLAELPRPLDQTDGALGNREAQEPATSPTRLRHSAFQTELLTLGLRGNVFVAGDPDYNRVRAVVPGNYDPRPQAVVRVADATDVAAVVRFARSHQLELAVRSGGHSGHTAKTRDILIDLRGIHQVQVDKVERTAWVGAGNTAGEVTFELEKHKLIVGFGDTASVGVGGLTLGGGIGYLVRKHGLTIDSLLSAEVVTATGEVLVVDEQRHPDLFWAIRGGGGNFGIVTRWKYRLQPLPAFTGGPLVLPATPEVISRFVELCAAAPEELSAIATVMAAPPEPFLSVEVHGTPVLFCMMAFAGEPQDAQAALAPFRALAAPLADLVQPGRYSDLYAPEDPSQKPCFSVRSRLMDELQPSTAAQIIGHIDYSCAVMRLGEIRVLGGAMARVATDGTAFAHRKSRIMFSFIAIYQDPAEQTVHDRWATDGIASLPHDADRVYVNFLLTDPAERIHAAYPPPTMNRLRQIKKRYDPENLFRMNRNILPD